MKLNARTTRFAHTSSTRDKKKKYRLYAQIALFSHYSFPVFKISRGIPTHSAHFCNYVGHIVVQALEMDGGPILYFTSSFSTIDRFIILYCALVLSELEFACRNSVTLTEPSKFEIIQTKRAQMCYNRIFCMNTCTLTNYDISATLNLSTLQPRLRHLAVHFPVNVLVIKFAAPPVLVQSVYAYPLH